MISDIPNVSCGCLRRDDDLKWCHSDAAISNLVQSWTSVVYTGDIWTGLPQKPSGWLLKLSTITLPECKVDGRDLVPWKEQTSI